ncbi:MAG: DUF1801 domain-containing protein [Ignavibacteria bacterium]|nr:DUF1801 domain-containing protein [Ignavibacteria bacterium]
MKTEAIKNFISNLPEEQKYITFKLREIILETNPSFEEKFAYGVPYYYLNKRVCFVWPTSVPRSGFKSGVIFGISNGVILKKKFDIISCGSCKVVGWIQYHNLKEIKPKKIKEILTEAIIFQEMQNLNF